MFGDHQPWGLWGRMPPMRHFFICRTKELLGINSYTNQQTERSSFLGFQGVYKIEPSNSTSEAPNLHNPGVRELRYRQQRKPVLKPKTPKNKRETASVSPTLFEQPLHDRLAPLRITLNVIMSTLIRLSRHSSNSFSIALFREVHILFWTARQLRKRRIHLQQEGSAGGVRVALREHEHVGGQQGKLVPRPPLAGVCPLVERQRLHVQRH
eukprot:1106189-Prorocentrum_minimum.AAC.1